MREENPSFVLMEEGALTHTTVYNNREREKFGICKAKWPSFSPGFNPIERIWNWMRAEVDGRDESAETVEAMWWALQETWEALSIDRINKDIEK